MVWFIMIAGVAFVLGTIFDAFEVLPYFLAVASLAAVLTASLLILASGFSAALVTLGSTGALGLVSSWDKMLD